MVWLNTSSTASAMQFAYSMWTTISIGTQSTLGARHFCQKIYVWNINKMPKFYMIKARKINKIPLFYLIIYPQKLFSGILGVPSWPPVSYAMNIVCTLPWKHHVEVGACLLCQAELCQCPSTGCRPVTASSCRGLKHIATPLNSLLKYTSNVNEYAVYTV